MNHIENIKRVYFEKYKIMLGELEKLKNYGIEYMEPNGGLSLWLKLPKEIDAFELYKECYENNLSIVPGKIFYIDNNIYNNYIRISFGAVSNEEIVKGVNILYDILNEPFKNNKYLPFI